MSAKEAALRTMLDTEKRRVERLKRAMAAIAKESDKLNQADRMLSEVDRRFQSQRLIPPAEIKQARELIFSVLQRLVGIYSQAFKE